MKISHLKEDIECIMKEAGNLLLSFWHKHIREIPKEHGFVTQADLEVELFLKNGLSRLVQADFWAEESGKTGTVGNGYTWVIDPLDGTTNFAHHIPYFCISVALTKNDIPIVGALYNPLLGEFFYADSNTASTLNDVPIRLSAVQKESLAFVGIGLPYGVAERGEMINTAQLLSPHVRALRHYGAVALDLANLACGRLDAVAFSRLFWWDIAAGVILVKQAGGTIGEFNGDEVGPSFRTCLASNPYLYDILKELLKYRVEG